MTMNTKHKSYQCANGAILSYRLPSEQMVNTFECAIEEQAFSENSLLSFDFVFAPYNIESTPVLWLKYIKPIENLVDAFELSMMDNYCISKEEYLEQGKIIIEKLQFEEINKLVYSRVSSVYSTDIQITKFFDDLLNKYPDAFCYFLYIPGKMCWMGASPEILLTRDADEYATVALAGTKSTENNIDSVEWSQKELDEHSYIERYLDSVLSINLVSFDKSEKYTSSAGAMFHIKSDYRFSSKLDSDTLIRELHPGPALTGFPKMEAIHYLNDFENHDRKYYTGFLGPIGPLKKWSLYVNLRCMEICKEGYLIYLGGGYTKSSSAEAEWNETELKATTMKAIINA